MSITMWIDFSLQKIYLQCNLVDRFSPSEKACHGFRATTRGPGGPKNDYVLPLFIGIPLS